MTIDKYLEICDYIKNIIKNTIFDNHIYTVGGCVRDKMMNNDIKDIDIVLDIENGGISFAQWLEKEGYTTGNIVVYPTYGTAMIHLKQYPDVELEFVHTRKEQYKDKNSRNPETGYGTIYEDAMRRDLTINALYYNVSTKEYFDPTGKGINDICQQRLRVTSTPQIVFQDDSLRILRVIRFSCRYGWEIDRDTFKGMINNVNRLSIITQERITDEFNKMLLSQYPVRAINLIKQIGAMKYVLPELEQTYDMQQNKYHFGTVYQHTIAVLENISQYGERYLPLQLAALLHDIGKLETIKTDINGNIHFYQHENASERMCDVILHRMKYSNDIIKEVKFLVLNHMRTKQWKDDCSHMKNKSLRKLQYECKTYDMFLKLMKLIDADNNAHATDYCMRNQIPIIIERTKHMLHNDEHMFEYKLPVSGTDIMEYKKLSPGKEIKVYLDYLLKIAYSKPKITKEECLKHIKNYKIN